MKKIELWENPPYIKYSNTEFRASITEFKINDKPTAVIVCPGGGSWGTADHEKSPIAEMFNQGGINAYTLDYSVNQCHKFAPLADVQRAIRILRSMNYEKIAVCGFSAGGHLTCTSATMYNFKAYAPTDEIDMLSARPDAFIPCYPVVSFIKDYSHMGSRQALLRDEWENEELAMLFSNEEHVTSDTPPCFLWHTATDDVVPVKNSLALAEALSANKVYFEMHIFPVGCHGLGLAKDKNDVGVWSDCACTFLKNLGF